MQTKRRNLQAGMVLLPPLEAFIPDDHPIRRLNRVLDLSFVHEAVREHYCQDNGRPSIDPEVIIRLFLIQAIEGIPHVRDLMRQVQVNLAYRWFIGYELDEKLPDHSTLSKALDRFGDEIFDKLFKQSIAQCKVSGLIEGQVLHVDATTIRADIDKDRVSRDDSPVRRSSPKTDPDARFGHFPDGPLRPGYKQQTVVDGKSRVIVGLSVAPANHYEGEDIVDAVNQAIKHIGVIPKAVCADGAYGSGKNRADLEAQGIRLISPPPKAISHAGSDCFTTENFKYDEVKDKFICPAGCILSYIAKDKDKKRPDRRVYRARRSQCKACSLKDKCTRSPRRQLKVSSHHAAMIRLRADSKTESFKRLYRSRAPVAEGVFAEAKQWHSLGRAWRRGLSKMRVQCLLIAAVINLKRLVSLFIGCFRYNQIIKAFLEAIRKRIFNNWQIMLHRTKYNVARC